MTEQKLKEAGWDFKIEEVSAGVYRVLGSDRLGRSIEVTGTDPDTLLEQCKRDASQMLAGGQDKGDR